MFSVTITSELDGRRCRGAATGGAGGYAPTPTLNILGPPMYRPQPPPPLLPQHLFVFVSRKGASYKIVPAPLYGIRRCICSEWKPLQRHW